MMCLVSIPEDCPPGDDRGRIYTTTNHDDEQILDAPRLAALVRRGLARLSGTKVRGATSRYRGFVCTYAA